jgi:hypothetical protein
MTGTEALGLPTRFLTGLLRELLIDIANQKASAFRFDDPAQRSGPHREDRQVGTPSGVPGRLCPRH